MLNGRQQGSQGTRGTPPLCRMVRVSCFEELLLDEKQSVKGYGMSFPVMRTASAKALRQEQMYKVPADWTTTTASTWKEVCVTRERRGWGTELLERLAVVRACRVSWNQCKPILLSTYKVPVCVLVTVTTLGASSSFSPSRLSPARCHLDSAWQRNFWAMSCPGPGPLPGPGGSSRGHHRCSKPAGWLSLRFLSLGDRDEGDMLSYSKQIVR